MREVPCRSRTGWRGCRPLLSGLLAAALLAGARPSRAWFESGEVGARALGFAGAFVSAADDPSAIYWNPAGLVQLRRDEALISFDHRSDLTELQNGFAAAALHLPPAVLGVGWQHSGVEATSTEDVWSLSVATAPVRRSLGAFVACGATVKVARVGIDASSLPSELAIAASKTGIATDLGLLAAPIPNVLIGATLRNLGEPQFDLVSGGSSTRLAHEFEWGASLRWRRDCWLHFARVRHPGGTTATRAGAELRLGNALGLRAGLGTDVVAGGVDVRSGRWTFDTAFRAHQALGTTYRVALRCGFGREHAGVGGQYDEF
jgi:hypothetical protein